MREQSLFPNVNQGITFIYFLRWTQCASKNGHNQGIPWWHSGLRIQPCHCCSSYHCCGTGLIPSLGTSTCHRCSQKKKKKDEYNHGDFGKANKRVVLICHSSLNITSKQLCDLNEYLCKTISKPSTLVKSEKMHTFKN